MFVTLKDWLSKFFELNTQITASLVGRNVLIDQVQYNMYTVHCTHYTAGLQGRQYSR